MIVTRVSNTYHYKHGQKRRVCIFRNINNFRNYIKFINMYCEHVLYIFMVNYIIYIYFENFIHWTVYIIVYNNVYCYIHCQQLLSILHHKNYYVVWSNGRLYLSYTVKSSMFVQLYIFILVYKTGTNDKRIRSFFFDKPVHHLQFVTRRNGKITMHEQWKVLFQFETFIQFLQFIKTNFVSLIILNN